MDFIEKLPESHGYDSILVIVNQATKWAIYIVTKTTLTLAQLANLLIDQVVSQHSLPESIVSDWGSKSLLDSGIMLHLRWGLSCTYQKPTTRRQMVKEKE